MGPVMIAGSVTEATRRYWLETVLAWAEVRLMPPQFDECKLALMLADPAANLNDTLPIDSREFVQERDAAYARGYAAGAAAENAAGWNAYNELLEDYNGAAKWLGVLESGGELTSAAESVTAMLEAAYQEADTAAADSDRLAALLERCRDAFWSSRDAWGITKTPLQLEIEAALSEHREARAALGRAETKT